MKAGKNHADDKRDAEPLALYSTRGELKVGGRCYYADNEGSCGFIAGISVDCPANSLYLDESTICICNPGNHESAERCVSGKTDCNEIVRNLKALSIPPADPRYGFYRNQTCIAEKSCGARFDMNDPGWLDSVVADFVNPLLRKEAAWSSLVDDCKKLVAIAGLRCQRSMADYHIKNDLQN